ncbi:hypothetical protein [Caballeronia sp. GAWG1-5s-s]|uniref:hypothetical protein n=1 Tax=Caballeronia sp. GAWG1-5s-s TaxID=2921743 RepID=UPI002027CDC4|nr:hypothetical protein [Caballeronia sp. GAWG1-5s-s]
MRESVGETGIGEKMPRSALNANGAAERICASGNGSAAREGAADESKYEVRQAASATALQIEYERFMAG